MAGPSDAPIRRGADDAFMQDRGHTTTRSTTEELIALGRDREALIAATGDTNQGGPMDGAEQLDALLPMLTAIVDRITPEQLSEPTPCAGFTVAGVLEHMIGGANVFAPAFRGETAAANGDTHGPQDLHAQFRAAMADLRDAVHSPGAQERTINAPFGALPGAVFARFVAFDGLVHGWDLTTSTGQPYTPPASVVAEADGFARQALGPEMRDGNTFAAETTPPADSSQLEALVAFTGRHVNRGEQAP
jgi:uncharacterized protein (TIGR03086 family)